MRSIQTTSSDTVLYELFVLFFCLLDTWKLSKKESVALGHLLLYAWTLLRSSFSILRFENFE